MSNEPQYCLGGCGLRMFAGYNSTIVPKYCNKCNPNKKVPEKRSVVAKKSKIAKQKPKGRFNFYSSKAWINCSHFVLTYYADNEGNVQCSTSGKWMHVTDKNCHCGHYIKVRDMSKTNYSVALEFTNLAPQSYQENIHRGGNQIEMRKWLVKQHGEKVIEDLELKQHNVCKPDLIYLMYWADFYEQQLEILLKKRGIKDFWKSK